MKIAYNWLKQFIKIDWNSDETAALLTDLGLEVEVVEKISIGIYELKESEILNSSNLKAVTELTLSGSKIKSIDLKYLSQYIQNTGDSKFFTVKTITIHPDHIAQLGSNYTYNVQDDFVGPELPVEFDDEDSHDEEERFSVQNEILISEEDDELLGEVFARLERKELKDELIALEEVSNDMEVTLETELLPTNPQTTTNESTDIDWF